MISDLDRDIMTFLLGIWTTEANHLYSGLAKDFPLQSLPDMARSPPN